MIKIPPAKSIHENKSSCREYVDLLISQSGTNLKEAVNLINAQYPEDQTTYQNFLNKVTRGTLRDYELAQLADVCGYELCMIPKKDNEMHDSPRRKKEKEFIQRAPENDATVLTFNNPNADYRDALKKISEDYDSVISQNFGIVTFAGKNAVKAVRRFKALIDATTAKASIEINPIRELTIIKMVENELDVIADFMIKPDDTNMGE